ncbi:MAG: type II secretion system protein GspK [Planctomycetaceae bacterium]|nr:type II secretion system protein GspK [Planctomycetaceae bacterium]
MKNIEYRALPELVGGTTDTHTLRSALGTLHSHARTGMILLVVIVIIALLSLAGYAFMALMNSELDSARQRGRDIQVQYISQSGVALIESVATLSPTERQWAGGTYDNPSLFCAAAIDGNLFSTNHSPRLTVVAPKLDSGRMIGIRYGLVNESGKLHLGKVLEWETANPGDGVNALRKLPGMTAQIAESLLDWIDADDQQRPGGAEAAWYAQQRLPYQPRNAVPVTLEEFLLVRGVTRQLMFGDDENFNFVPDSQESRMAGYGSSAAGTTGMQSTAGSSAVTPGIPWCHLLTVISAERDANPRGAARIDLNDANLQFLHSQLTQRVGLEIADFVILYRQYGTEELNAPPPDTSSGTTGASPRGGRGGVQGGAQGGAQGQTPRRGTRQTEPATTPDVAPGNGPNNALASDVIPDAMADAGLPIIPLPGNSPGNTSRNMPGDLSDLSATTPAEPPPPLTIPDDAPPTRGTQTRTRPASGRQSADQPLADQPSSGQPSTDPPATSVPVTSSEQSSPASAPQGRQERSPQGRPAAGQAGAGRQFQRQGGGRFGSRNARESRFSQYVDLQTPAQYRLETPLDIVGATVVIPLQNASTQVAIDPTTTMTVSTASASTEPAGIRL